LKYLIAEINYGGRVTDKIDVILIIALLSKYFTPQVFEEYKFDKNGAYVPPKDLEL